MCLHRLAMRTVQGCSSADHRTRNRCPAYRAVAVCVRRVIRAMVPLTGHESETISGNSGKWLLAQSQRSVHAGSPHEGGSCRRRTNCRQASAGECRPGTVHHRQSSCQGQPRQIGPGRTGFMGDFRRRTRAVSSEREMSRPSGAIFFRARYVSILSTSPTRSNLARTNEAEVEPVLKGKNDPGIFRAADRRVIIFQIARHAEMKVQNYGRLVGQNK